MKDFRTLKVLDRFAPLFERAGADYGTMRKILQIKLLMDGRRVPTIFSQTGGKGKGKKGAAGSANKEADSSGNQFLRSLWLYALIGLIMVPFIIMGTNYMFQLGFVFGVIMFTVTTSMISDFSSVLLDIRDKTILHTRPVDRKTIAMAKTVHVLIYMFYLTVSLTAVPLIAAFISHGILFVILFAVSIVLLDIGIVALTALVYLVVLRFLDGEKLKDMINYVQIGLSIAVTIGYQLVGRSFEIVNVQVNFEPKWWAFLVPPLWFAAPFELLLHGNRAPLIAAFSVLALVMPLIAIYVYIKLTPAFERHLQKLSSVDGERRRRRMWADRLAALVCSGREERVFFRFASQMLRSEREFKLKVYPSIGLSFVFPFIFIFNEMRDEGWDGSLSPRWILTVYFSLIVIPTLLMTLRYSGKYKGAWIYKTIPVADTASIFKGTIKAVLLRLFVPLFAVQSFVYVWLLGAAVIPDMAVILLCGLMYAVISFLSLGKTMPFSESFEEMRSETWKTLPLILLIPVFAALHLGLTFLDYSVYVYLVVLIGVNLLLWGRAFRPSH